MGCNRWVQSTRNFCHDANKNSTFLLTRCSEIKENTSCVKLGVKGLWNFQKQLWCPSTDYHCIGTNFLLQLNSENVIAQRCYKHVSKDTYKLLHTRAQVDAEVAEFNPGWKNPKTKKTQSPSFSQSPPALLTFQSKLAKFHSSILLHTDISYTGQKQYVYSHITDQELLNFT